MTEEPDAPGWDAIDRALHPIYGGREPKHYAPILKRMFGGPDPLDGISAYKRTDGVCHWHFVSYGLTDLYAKEGDDPEVSGYGFELTFRLACTPEDMEPPVWALNFLQNLSRYVFETGNVFASGHHMTLNGPIASGKETDIGAVIFATDPDLPDTKSPYGNVSFVQIVGITDDELEAVQGWNSSGFTDLLRTRSPLLITDLSRKSMLADPALLRVVSEGTEREGSSTAELYVSVARWKRTGFLTKRTTLTMDALTVSGFIRQLRGRLLHQRPLLVIGKGGQAENVAAFLPEDKSSIAISESGCLTISVSPDAARAMLETLRPQRGNYHWPQLKDLELQVVPTEIKDREGKVIRIVG